MSPVKPGRGLVISYAYLWRSESIAGREEGIKERPVLIVSATPQPEGWERVVVLPITHAPPAGPDLAREIPVAIRRHLRLDDERCWIVVGEANVFHWPGPDLGHSAPGDSLVYERVPPRFFEKVRQEFVTQVRAGRMLAVKRTG